MSEVHYMEDESCRGFGKERRLEEN